MAHQRTKIVPSNPLRADPTRSATLRRVFLADVNRRFARLRQKIIQLVVVEDAFGLKRESTGFAPLAERGIVPAVIDTTSLDRRFGRVVNNMARHNVGVITNNRWKFLTDERKIEAFRQWMSTQIAADIVNVTAANIEQAWWQQYAEEGYRKGAGRAFDDVNHPALQGNLDFFNGTKRQFLQQSFGQPVAIEKVKLLTSRVFSDLKGVTDAMSQQITRELADGLVQGDNVRTIGRRMAKSVDSIGRVRANTIARTEIIRAHAEGQLDSLERLGVTEVGVAVEWSTASDDRVCPLCQPLEGVVMSIKEARGIIPRHPNCRCAFVPANVGEDKRGQKRGKRSIDAAVRRSLKAERPKRSKRSVETQRRLSPWQGAGKRISKNRPKSILD